MKLCNSIALLLMILGVLFAIDLQSQAVIDPVLQGMGRTGEIRGNIAHTNLPQTHLKLENSKSLKQSSEALSAYTLTMNSLGLIRIGMTVSEASRVSGYRLVMTYRTPDINLRSASDKICSVWKPLGAEEGVSFLATDNIIARIDVSNSRISTLGGARVGDSKERILEMYSGRARVTGKTLSGRGEVITLFPSRPEDSIDF